MCQIRLLLKSTNSSSTLLREGLGLETSPEIHCTTLAMVVSLGISGVPPSCTGGHWFLQCKCIH